MVGFPYRDGVLCAENVPLARIADAVGTPTYVYSLAALDAAYRTFADAFADQDVMLCYALKANSNQAIVRALARLGAGADVVSEGELRRALAAGIPADRIVFAGVGKTRDEMAAALDAGILQFNVESFPELDMLSEVAASKGVTAPVAIRVNPDVDARTHAKISTGRKENKFGIDFEHAEAAFERAARLPGLRVESVAVHIGSQLTNLDPFREAFGRLANLVRRLRAAGYALRRVDLGGGLGVAYRSEETGLDATAYATAVRETMGDLGLPLVLEPGRWLVAASGVLLTRTLYVKEGIARRFAIVDAAMNDLIRPTLYDAHHPIWPVREPTGPADAETAPYDVVGPICETGDRFAEQRSLPPVRPGDLLAFGAAGAYAAVMASSYNSRPLAAEVMVCGDDFAVIRPRQSYDEMIGRDRIPAWLNETAVHRPAPATGTLGD